MKYDFMVHPAQAGFFNGKRRLTPWQYIANYKDCLYARLFFISKLTTHVQRDGTAG